MREENKACERAKWRGVEKCSEFGVSGIEGRK